jgi:hypothetical protein
MENGLEAANVEIIENPKESVNRAYGILDVCKRGTIGGIFYNEIISN